MRFRVSRIVIHRNYNKKNFNNGIALLELDPSVQEFTDYVSPICLPRHHLSERSLASEKYARIVDWGRILEGGSYPRYLREVAVPHRV